MTETAVKNLLERQIYSLGSQSRWAKLHGVSPQHLSDTLLGRRDLGPKILDALGIERVVSYQYRGARRAGSERTAIGQGR